MQLIFRGSVNREINPSKIKFQLQFTVGSVQHKQTEGNYLKGILQHEFTIKFRSHKHDQMIKGCDLNKVSIQISKRF